MLNNIIIIDAKRFYLIEAGEREPSISNIPRSRIPDIPIETNEG